METYFLDAGGAGLFAVVIGLGIFFIVLAILIEAILMNVMKYNPFKKAFLNSTVCNLTSIAAGAILLGSFSEAFDIHTWGGFAAMLGVTLVVEFAILYGLNREKPVGKTAVVSMVTNLVTYIILCFIANPGNFLNN